MITVLENPQIRSLAEPLSVKGYHLLRDWGIVDVKTELINGVMVKKMSKSPLHTYIVNVLFALLEAQCPADYWLRKEDPLTLIESEPEPDISVIKGSLYDFKSEHPKTAELVIEVAISSLHVDRTKADIYAAADIPWYGLVNVNERQIEVYTQPENGVYQQQHVCHDNVSMPYVGKLSLDDLFES